MGRKLRLWAIVFRELYLCSFFPHDSVETPAPTASWVGIVIFPNQLWGHITFSVLLFSSGWTNHFGEHLQYFLFYVWMCVCVCTHGRAYIPTLTCLCLPRKIKIVVPGNYSHLFSTSWCIWGKPLLLGFSSSFCLGVQRIYSISFS